VRRRESRGRGRGASAPFGVKPSPIHGACRTSRSALGRRRPARVAVHHRISEDAPGREKIVRGAGEPDVVDRGPAAKGEWLDVVVLEPSPAVAPLAGREPPLALPTGAAPDLPLHLGRDRIAAGRSPSLPRLLHEPLALRVLGEDEVEAALEDLRRAASRAGVPERVLRSLELLEEAAGDRDVDAGEVGVERLHGFAGCRVRRRRHGDSHDDGGRRSIRSRAVRWISSWFTPGELGAARAREPGTRPGAWPGRQPPGAPGPAAQSR
jgi:hypothetical protein